MYHLEQYWEAEERPSYQVKYLRKHNFYVNGISPIELSSDKGKTETLNKFVWLEHFIPWINNEDYLSFEVLIAL